MPARYAWTCTAELTMPLQERKHHAQDTQLRISFTGVCIQGLQGPQQHVLCRP